MAKPTDKTPQEVKREKLREQFQAATGISFPQGEVFGLMMATNLNDAMRTGAHDRPWQRRFAYTLQRREALHAI